MSTPLNGLCFLHLYLSLQWDIMKYGLGWDDLVRISFIFVILYLKIKNALSISAVLTMAQIKGPNVQDIV